MRISALFCLIVGAMTLCRMSLLGEGARVLLDNNLRCVDLSDLTSSVPLAVSACTQILWRTESWEHNTFDASDTDSVGYPSVVRNDRGRNPDRKYYLYYAHHDPCSGIGCAVADSVEGPYRKLVDVETGRRHSMALVNPHYPIPHPPVTDPSHYSSPCVVWNRDKGCWFMYFHYFNHFYEAWKKRGDAGYGHQMTGLATCSDLRANDWTVLKDPALEGVSVWGIAPVLPTTEEPWMNSQSSYHAIQRLADGRWLAFLRGTSNNQVTGLGFAFSSDGRTWRYGRGNPVVYPGDGGGLKGIYRPGFVAYLGKNRSGAREYLVAWSESPAENDTPKIRYGYTSDFVTVRRDPRGYADWAVVSDGPVSPWREGTGSICFRENIFKP